MAKDVKCKAKAFGIVIKGQGYNSVIESLPSMSKDLGWILSMKKGRKGGKKDRWTDPGK